MICKLHLKWPSSDWYQVPAPSQLLRLCGVQAERANISLALAVATRQPFSKTQTPLYRVLSRKLLFTYGACVGRSEAGAAVLLAVMFAGLAAQELVIHSLFKVVTQPKKSSTDAANAGACAAGASITKPGLLSLTTHRIASTRGAPASVQRSTRPRPLHVKPRSSWSASEFCLCIGIGRGHGILPFPESIVNRTGRRACDICCF